MADVPRSRFVDSPVTLRQLIRGSYSGEHQKRWLAPIDRGEKHTVTLDKVTRWKVHYRQGTPEREKVASFRIRIMNAKPDGKHSNYPTTILVDQLNLDSSTKVRCGSLAQYSPKMSRDQMKDRQICGDFYFKYMQAHADNGSLYNRDSTNGKPAKIMNPEGVLGFCKHLTTACKLLISSNFFSQVDRLDEYYGNVKFMKQFK